MKISMITAAGATLRAMVTCGRPSTFPTAGLRIDLDIGLMYGPGAGHGLRMNPGASLRSTTAAGHLRVADGAGCQDPLQLFRCIRRRWSCLLAADPVSALALDGSCLLLVRYMFPGIAPVRDTSRT